MCFNSFSAVLYNRYRTDTSVGTKDKEGRLDESDELWVKIRHKHIADVLEYVFMHHTFFIYSIFMEVIVFSQIFLVVC